MYKKRRKIKMIVKALREGNLLYPALHSAGITSSTIDRWRHANPRLARLIERAREVSDNKRVELVEDAVIKSARDGNPTAQIFFLSNRAPGRWKRHDPAINLGVQVSQSQGVFVSPVKQLKDEELDAIIARR